jgi:hypothetical protein
MRTDDLIADLAGHVQPVRPLSPPGLRAMGWLVVALACAAVGVACFGARPDVLVRLTQPDYLWTAAVALATSALAVIATLVLSVPGAERTPALRRATVAALVLWAVTMVWAVLDSGRPLPITTDRHWPACFTRVVLVSFVPVIVLFGMARRAAPLRLGWTGAFAALAASSIAALAVQIVCPLDDAGHAFLGHFIPVVLIAALGVIVRGALARRAIAQP